MRGEKKCERREVRRQKILRNLRLEKRWQMIDSRGGGESWNLSQQMGKKMFKERPSRRAGPGRKERVTCRVAKHQRDPQWAPLSACH